MRSNMPLPANDPCVVIGQIESIEDATRSPQYPKKSFRLNMVFNVGKDGKTNNFETQFTVDGYALDNMTKDGVRDGNVVAVSFIPSGFEWKGKLLTENKVRSVRIKGEGSAPKASGPRPSDRLNYNVSDDSGIPF